MEHGEPRVSGRHERLRKRHDEQRPPGRQRAQATYRLPLRHGGGEVGDDEHRRKRDP